jgi:hypothetical protein
MGISRHAGCLTHRLTAARNPEATAQTPSHATSHADVAGSAGRAQRRNRRSIMAYTWENTMLHSPQPPSPAAASSAPSGAFQLANWSRRWRSADHGTAAPAAQEANRAALGTTAWAERLSPIRSRRCENVPPRWAYSWREHGDPGRTVRRGDPSSPGPARSGRVRPVSRPTWREALTAAAEDLDLPRVEAVLARRHPRAVIAANPLTSGAREQVERAKGRGSARAASRARAG